MALQIFPIPALCDNLIWVIQAPQSSDCVIVDPGDAQAVIRVLQSSGLRLTAILVTHHHWDHTQGISELLTRWSVPVLGPAQETIAGRTHPLKMGDAVNLLEGALRLSVLEVPGHTRGHIAYIGDEILFCGDTLFSAGCGRVFEGNAETLYTSLGQLNSLAGDTYLYCGHEYTETNLRFALSLEPDNRLIQRRLQAVQAMRAVGNATLPVQLSEERLSNPFLRCEDVHLKAAVNRRLSRPCQSALEVFCTLRRWKDDWG